MALAGCSGGGATTQTSGTPKATIKGGAPHSHGPGHEHISSLVGDGTQSTEAGYTLANPSLPKTAGLPGAVRFQIRTPDGTLLKDYIPEQTKDLHLYLVRTDLAVFRHLHPTLDDDGTWSAPVTLPEAGDYRVITAFVARSAVGNGDHLMLGKTVTLPGPWSPQPIAVAAGGDDGVIHIGAEGDLRVGSSSRLSLVVNDAQGRPVKLGTYLGTFAHVTGFHVESGSVVHLHPLGQPEIEEEGTRLTFHTEFESPGEYLCFVQVRVDGFLHTIPVGVEVA